MDTVENSAPGVAQPPVYNQGIFNQMSLPINDDYMACSHAVQDLLKEGWKFVGFSKDLNVYLINLTREWRC